MDLVSAADELYGMPLTDFIAARTRLEKQARAAGDRQLASDLRALRKPSQAAWAVNQIVRRSPEILDDLLSLGDELRTAQEGGDTLGLRRLTGRRRELYAALRGRAEELVVEDGRTFGADVAQALESTAGAAMADPQAAQVVRSGRLVVDLENAGWGPIDLDGAQAAADVDVSRDAGTTRDATVERAEPPRGEAERRDAERREAERLRSEAEDAEARAAAALSRADEALHAASAEQRRLTEHKEALLAELREVEAGEARAAEDVRSAREARSDAAREIERTTRLATRARQHVEDLTTGI